MKKITWNTPRWALTYEQGIYEENKYYVQMMFPRISKNYIGRVSYNGEEIFGERRRYIINKAKSYMNNKYKIRLGSWEK